ncbi:hypothetical protein BD410DRAFT_782226 [Rickenella mellea]|uniref:IgA peptidase M64-domain-containing protein n=1 Tax=Rickenella mellea TaxID=50990 RepID=A0A4Y7QMG7_9AGAM|nr:hypothetical protein BD410DRAFT_782226 [Rickenella mellea]
MLRPVDWILLSVLALSVSSHTLRHPYELEIHYEGAPLSSPKCRSLSFRETQLHKKLKHMEVVESFGKVQYGHGNSSQVNYLQSISHDKSLLWSQALTMCGDQETWAFPVFDSIENNHAVTSSNAGQAIMSHKLLKDPDVLPPPLQITPLVSTGHSSNRVDLVFFSDGYTEEEHVQFIHDARRLALDISNNQTFSTVRPLLNFWAAFSPSNDSGIGVGGHPKDTVFGLYRDGTELRGVYYAKPETAHAACVSMGDKCDYPILLGNDPFYGGLGGRFTVTTSSEINGALVLRHELGHSIIEVGEEYDGGFAYFGVNAATNLSHPFPWAHWLSENVSSPRHERSVVPLQEYPWTILNTTSPWTVAFNSSGTYSTYVVQFSLSGIPDKDHLKISMDGIDLEWQPRKDIGVDRWHYAIARDAALRAGEHTVSFKLGAKALVGQAQLCSVEIIEFASSDEFNTTNGFIGAFPTYSDTNETTYRPTNDKCLMRTVTSPNFCEVCVEGLWLSLLERVDLIDDVQTRCHMAHSGVVQRMIDVSLVPLAQYRANDGGTGGNHEAYVVKWSTDGRELPMFENQTTIAVDNLPGSYTVEVHFITDEVRLDPYGYLTSVVDITIPGVCVV